MKDVTNAILDNYSLNNIFRIILETMFRGLKPSGIERALLFIKDTKLPIMDLRLALGDSTDRLRTWFKVPLDNASDLFNVAIGHQRALFITDTTDDRIQQILPEWYSEHVPWPALVILLPIVARKKPIGLIYLEGDPEHSESVTASHLNYLRVLLNQAILALKQNQ
jgi:hypothetical protein